MPENRGQLIIPAGPWMGLWDRSGDGPPPDHLYLCDNAMFTDDIMHSRPGFSQLFAKNNIVRAVPFKISSAPIVGRWLILCNPSGNNYELFDSGVSLVTPIHTFTASGVVDMSVAVIYDRAYITYHNRISGLTSVNMQVWDPTFPSGVTRDAAGAAPAGTFTVATSATAGNVEPGFHVYAVAYETNTGHVTKPGLYVSLTAPATRKKVDLSVIPTGPVGTVARWILASKVVFNFDGNLENPKLFYALRIGDNTTTTLTGANGLDFYDSQLLSDADYLKDLYTTIPCGVALGVYTSRFCVGNIPDIVAGIGAPGGPIIIQKSERSMILISYQNQIESFSKVDGFQIIAKSEGGGIKQLSELNGVLYARKSFMTFALQDNGLPPAKWPINAVDIATGTEFMGVASFPGTSSGSYKGLQIVADRSGLYTFDGVYAEHAISDKVENAWRQFDSANFAMVNVTIDPERQIVYVLKTYTSFQGYSEIYVGDCNKGLDPSRIRWSRWVIVADVRSIFVDYVNSLTPTLVIQVAGTTNAGLYKLEDLASLRVQPSVFFFSGINALELFKIGFGKIPLHPNGGLGQIIQLMIRGAGLSENPPINIRPVLKKHEDSFVVQNFQTIPLEWGFPGGSKFNFETYLSKGLPFENDYVYIEFELLTSDSNWAISNVWVYYKPRADERPA